MVGVHRRPSRRVRGRVDLRRGADRPVDVLPPQGAAGGSRRAGRRGRSAMTSCGAAIQRVWDANIIRCTGRARCGGSCAAKASAWRAARVRRLMRELGLRGRRARPGVDRPRRSRRSRPRPAGRSRRAALHGDAARISSGSSDFTYVATWRGFVYVAFVIDVFARRIVGWRVVGVAAHRLRARCARAGDLRPLRRPTPAPGASQRSRHAVSVDALHRPAGRRRHRAVGRQPRRFVRQRPRRVGHRALQDGGDSTAGTVAAVWRPWNSPRSTWVDWFNTRRLLEPIGYVPPAEYEARYYSPRATGWRSPASQTPTTSLMGRPPSARSTFIAH